MLRDATAATDPGPTVLLVTLGPVAEHTARATFAKNLFEVAGIRAAEAHALSGSMGAGIAVLCGSDERYSSEASTVAGDLKAAGVRRVYLAGQPGDDEEHLRSSGIDEFIHVDSDVIEVLSRALDVLGVVR